MNAFLIYWEENVADTRIHGTVKKQLKAMFEAEKKFLKPLPDTLFPAFEEVMRKVHRDGHIELKKSFYSVPPEYVRKEVWVRYNFRTVTIFNQRMKQIALHIRAEPGCFSTHRYHIPQEKINNIEHGNAYLLKQTDRIGGEAGAWARTMLQNRGIPGERVLSGMLQLSDKYTASAINKACKIALNESSFHLKELKFLIEDNFKLEQQKFAFLSEHPLIRQTSDYNHITNDLELFYEQQSV